MNLEHQVCSLELSKKLKELGVKQESLFYYYCYINPISVKKSYHLLHEHSSFMCKDNLTISAFTASELLELLPKGISFIKEISSDEYCVCGIRDKNLPNACAKILIYLIENKLMEINKCIK